MAFAFAVIGTVLMALSAILGGGPALLFALVIQGPSLSIEVRHHEKNLGLSDLQLAIANAWVVALLSVALFLAANVLAVMILKGRLRPWGVALVSISLFLIGIGLVSARDPITYWGAKGRMVRVSQK